MFLTEPLTSHESNQQPQAVTFCPTRPMHVHVQGLAEQQRQVLPVCSRSHAMQMPIQPTTLIKALPPKLIMQYDAEPLRSWPKTGHHTVKSGVTLLPTPGRLETWSSQWSCYPVCNRRLAPVPACAQIIGQLFAQFRRRAAARVSSACHDCVHPALAPAHCVHCTCCACLCCHMVST